MHDNSSLNELQIPASKSVVVFDGECAFCDGFVSKVLAKDHAQNFIFVPRQSPLGEKLVQKFNLQDYAGKSMVLLSAGQTFVRSTAALKILQSLEGTKFISSCLLLLPLVVRDTGYRIFSSLRYKLFGRLESCRIPSAAERGRVLWDSFN